MHVLETHPESTVQGPFRTGLGPLIRDVGTQKFDETLHRVMGSILRCEYVTAFAFGRHMDPRLVTIAAGTKTGAARDAARRYIGLHWHEDPSNIFKKRDLLDGKSYIVFMSATEVDDKHYRTDCYLKTQIAYRVSILQKFDDEHLKISFHRSEEAGPFQPEALFDLSQQADLLGSLMLKHSSRCGEFSIEPASVGNFERKLEERRPQLTARERQVCSLISAGMSSEAIALTLGISINTVLTFRRRAYARLNISSQTELLHIVYS